MNEHSTGSDVVYGEPTVDDVDAIAELFVEDMTDLGMDTSMDAMRGLVESIVEDLQSSDPQCVCWVARPGESQPPCGVVLANFNWSLKFGGRALWIEEMYVTPAHRRRGIGRALVDRVLDYAEAHGFHGIDLEAYQGNTSASVLYRTMGFHRLGRERFYFHLGDQQYL